MKNLLILTLGLTLCPFIAANPITFEMLEEAIENSNLDEFKTLTQEIGLSQTQKLVLLDLTDKVLELRKTQMEMAEVKAPRIMYPELVKSVLCGIGGFYSTSFALNSMKYVFNQYHENVDPEFLVDTLIFSAVAITCFYKTIKSAKAYAIDKSPYTELYQNTIKIRQHIYRIPELTPETTIEAQ